MSNSGKTPEQICSAAVTIIQLVDQKIKSTVLLTSYSFKLFIKKTHVKLSTLSLTGGQTQRAISRWQLVG